LSKDKILEGIFMEFRKCNRCGSFFVTNGNVCPKCTAKDNLEFSTFKNYIEENGFNGTLGSISSEIGISEKNLNRFLGYDGLKDYDRNLTNKFNSNEGNNGITFN
jgi:hypothetical protein